MTVLYFTALVLGRRDTADSGVLAVALFVAGVFLASASWQLVIAGGGTVVGRALTGPRGRLVTGAGLQRAHRRAGGGRAASKLRAGPPERAWVRVPPGGPRGFAVPYGRAMTSPPAAGGGRWVEVDPARVGRWVEGFADRHGPPTTSAQGYGLLLAAPDGATAELYAPPGAPAGVDVAGFVASAVMPRRIGLLLARKGAVALGVAEGGDLVVSKVDTRYVQGRTAAGDGRSTGSPVGVTTRRRLRWVTRRTWPYGCCCRRWRRSPRWSAAVTGGRWTGCWPTGGRPRSCRCGRSGCSTCRSPGTRCWSRRWARPGRYGSWCATPTDLGLHWRRRRRRRWGDDRHAKRGSRRPARPAAGGWARGVSG